jgi:uncharacterized protein (TIGR02996 family)
VTTDETALLAAIAAYPDEDTPRLMLADLYDEWGEPQKACDQRLAVCLRAVKVSLADDAPRLEYAGICERYGRTERGEFIRVQCELMQLVREDCPVELDPAYQQWHGLKRRERELLTKPNRTKWAGESLRPLIFDHIALRTLWERSDLPEDCCEYSRGFVRRVTCEAEDWLAHGDAIVREHPIEKVALTTAPTPDFYRLVNAADIADNIFKAIERRWPGIKFTLSTEQMGTATWDNLAEGPSLAPAINDAAAMIAEFTERQAAREIAAEREVLSRLVKEYPTREVILARASGPMSFPPSVECDQCGMRTGFEEDDEASTAPSLASYRVMVAVCAGCRRVYVGVIPHG